MSDELTVRLFATLKERAGNAHITTPLPMPATVHALISQLCQQYPELADYLPSCIVAINQQFADAEQAVQLGDEIALFPPVSGGEKHPTYFAVTAKPIDVNAIYANLVQPDVGAIGTFSGFVRGKTERAGMPAITHQLEYEAYEAMAIAKMTQIAQEIWKRWHTVKGIAIVQRIGKLTIGETTTLVACAAGHRDEGVFEAARYGIDRLKEIVPVWKKEIGPNQSIWVEGAYHPSAQDN